MDKEYKEIVDDIDEFNQNTITCRKCNHEFVFLPSETWWNEQGTYSEKLVKCTCCESINSVRYVDAIGLRLNYDKKYYE